MKNRSLFFFSQRCKIFFRSFFSDLAAATASDQKGKKETKTKTKKEKKKDVRHISLYTCIFFNDNKEEKE